MQVIESGQGEYRRPDPDGFRRFVRDNKTRAKVDKVVSAAEAVSRFVPDGAYLSYDTNVMVRGPSVLVREIIRQRKRDLWVAAKFTAQDVTLMVAGGCVSRVDVGWLEVGRVIQEAMNEGRVKFIEWSNSAMALRHMAGAMGVPFLPLRYLGGTDSFRESGAKLVQDPFTGESIVLVPALNPDVALIHAHQADRFGNARIFGPGIAPVETAAAAKRLVITTEELVEPEEIRRAPGLTSVPYYMVDAVVHAPFGAYPGSMPGMYRAHLEHFMEFGMAQAAGRMAEYLEKWVYSVASDDEMIEKHVGKEKLAQLREAETVREGYQA
ncbi:MAG TPA: CoA-transferase [Dehalococcoidia bacterium]|nr:CoA-transferase [Dehalococcoidia bacterium]